MGSLDGMGRAIFRISRISILAAAVVMFGAIGLGQQTVSTADAACAPCHGNIYRDYLATPMANASGPAADRAHVQAFTHDPSSMRYQVLREQDLVLLKFNDLKDARVAGTRPLAYYLGSGHLGVTYLYLQEGYLLESPVAWYAATGNYDMKPGFAGITEMPPALPSEPSCLRCHMSEVQPAEAGSINRYAGLPFRQTGITCEACHGDATAHLRTGGKASVINPNKLSAERRDSICMSCHLEGDISVERTGRRALDYTPGQSISEYLSFFVFRAKDSLSRGVSETEQFSASQCKQVSGDAMSCTSCHDPHTSPSAQERVAFYRAKCLACHAPALFSTTHHSETPDCTRCHMPQSTARNIPHVAWTDHRILRRPEVAPANPSALQTGQGLIAVFSPNADQRDAAVAAYLAVVRGKSRDTQGALGKLEQVYAQGDRDPQVLEGLGVLSGLSGNAAESEQRLRELLTLQSLDITAISDLGVLMARKGKMGDAVSLWRPALARNRDITGLALNLAAAQCRTGDAAGARTTIRDTLRFSPGVRQALNFRCDN